MTQYSGIIKKLITILLQKLHNTAILLYKIDENTSKYSDLFTEFAQMQEVLTWCMQLLQNYKSNDLALFCEIADELQRNKRMRENWNKIKPDLQELLHSENMQNYYPIIEQHYALQ